MIKKPHEIISSKIKVSPLVLSVGILVNLVYISWWLNFNNAGNIWLYGLLLIGEIYHVWQALGYIITIWDQNNFEEKSVNKFHEVDVFITVCGEPIEVIERTLKAAISMNYPNYNVYILNDGYAAKKDNWKEVKDLGKKYKVKVITRKNGNGAKAGNINNALRQTGAPYFAVFDADHVPSKQFLSKTMGYFEDEKMAIIQTPQYYENRKDGFLTKSAWEQQELFFGPICKGKNNMNATFWCGTNAVIKREALESINGIPEDNIAEDFLVSLLIHQKGWKTKYVPEILAKGLAPHNLKEYVKQQYRWARGSLEITFKHNPFFKSGLTIFQKIQYLYSSTYYLNGLVILIDAIIPLIVLETGIIPVSASTDNFILFFFPFILTTIYILITSTNHTITFSAIQMSMSLFYVYIKAAIATVIGKNAKFEVTSKKEESGNFLNFALPHFLYLFFSIVVITRALLREGPTANVINNTAWIVFNVTLFFGFIRVSYPWNAALQKVVLFFTTDRKEDLVSAKDKKEKALIYTSTNEKENPQR